MEIYETSWSAGQTYGMPTGVFRRLAALVAALSLPACGGGGGAGHAPSAAGNLAAAGTGSDVASYVVHVDGERPLRKHYAKVTAYDGLRRHRPGGTGSPLNLSGTF